MMQFPKTPEADVASGVIHVTVNGQPKTLPTLKIADFEDTWLPSQAEALKGLFADDEDREPAELLKLGTNVLLDAIVAYDKTGALGGRDWLRANADHADLYAVARAIYERHADPFIQAARAILGGVRQLTQQMAAVNTLQRLQEKSTNGASPNGESTPAA